MGKIIPACWSSFSSRTRAGFGMLQTWWSCMSHRCLIGLGSGDIANHGRRTWMLFWWRNVMITLARWGTALPLIRLFISKELSLGIWKTCTTWGIRTSCMYYHAVNFPQIGTSCLNKILFYSPHIMMPHPQKFKAFQMQLWAYRSCGCLYAWIMPFLHESGLIWEDRLSLPLWPSDVHVCPLKPVLDVAQLKLMA